MTENSSSLPAAIKQAKLWVRLASAAIGLFIFALLWWKFAERGLTTICIFVTVVAQWEFTLLAFRSIEDSVRFRILFLVQCLVCFFATLMPMGEGLIAFGIMAII